MRRAGKLRVWLAAIFCLVAILAVYVSYQISFNANYEVVEVDDYINSKPKDDLELTDDTLDEKHPAFKENLVDSRPVGDWELNASAAVIRLDCPSVKPGVEDGMLELNANYAQAIEKARQMHKTLLPSANMLDGIAKQFDDGLYAALDLACYRGELGFAASAPDFIESLFLVLPEKSPARPFLAGALELAEKPQKLSAEEERQKAKFLAEFAGDQVRSKPISFYNWTPELQRVWKFYRYLQWDLSRPKLYSSSVELFVTLNQQEQLAQQYRPIFTFYAKLTNPPSGRLQPLIIIADVTDTTPPAPNQGIPPPPVRTVFPPSTSRETELFEHLFANGLPESANLMSELIRNIRSGKVDLKPNKFDGWYQYQAYALESMLLPLDSQENEKLLLTAAYKKRLVEAFKALLTKRRETHARQNPAMKCASKPLDKGQVCPRLRVEPCATFYLRTARAYAFLQNFLLTTIGEEKLSNIHGLRESGVRQLNLAKELETMRQRFYGFYLISCEDLGMEPQLLPDEPVDQAAVKQSTLNWLGVLEIPDSDLKSDTRVSIPIAQDLQRNATRFWATLGVRLAPLEAKYARPPKVRPRKNDEKAEADKPSHWENDYLTFDKTGWADPPSFTLGISNYVLAVDEFAEFEIPGAISLTREEFRKICDKNQRDKEKILQDLKSYRESK